MADIKVVIQEEPRFEAIGEPGPYMVMEVDEGGGVLSTAYYADHDKAKEFALTITDSQNVQDDVTSETQSQNTVADSNIVAESPNIGQPLVAADVPLTPAEQQKG